MSLITGEYRDLLKRGIKEETCRFFGYMCGEINGSNVQIAPYFNSAGDMVAQKIRGADKEFKVLGDISDAQLFGAKHWGSGRKIVVTEGEIDCMTVSQVQANKWPVVSIPNGAQGAAKAIKKNLAYFDAFEEVVLMFDSDEPGTKAAQECATLFPPGKCKIASLPGAYKDPNELLQAGEGAQIITAIWQAKAYRPDGLVGIADFLDQFDKDPEMGLPWFLDPLTKITFGRRRGEIVGLGAGTGIGKTDFITQQIAYDVEVLHRKLGLIFLEQKPFETATRIAGKLAGKRFHVPDGTWTKDERKEWALKLQGSVTLYDSWGHSEWETVASKIRFMAVCEGVTEFYIDHLTAMADPDDERGSLEKIMKAMASLATELQIWILFVSHLATPEGKSHEEGGHVSIRHFKGARAIGFWSHFMLGLERQQQAEDKRERETTTLRVLKDRYTGQSTGALLYLAYDAATGLLSETDAPAEQSTFTDTSLGF